MGDTVRLLLKSLGLLALLLIVVTGAFAQDGRRVVTPAYALTLEPLWVEDIPAGEHGAMFRRAVSDEIVAVCGVVVGPSEQSALLTQAEINSAYEQAVSGEFWNEFVQRMNGGPLRDVREWSEPLGGVMGNRIVAAFTASHGEDVLLFGRRFAVPGQDYGMVCLHERQAAGQDLRPLFAESIERMLRSFAPLER